MDNLDLISPKGLFGAYKILKRCLESLENNFYIKSKFLTEPFMTKYNLYPTISKGNISHIHRNLMNILAYADGQTDLLQISNTLNVFLLDILEAVELLKVNKIIDVKHQKFSKKK